MNGGCIGIKRLLIVLWDRFASRCMLHRLKGLCKGSSKAEGASTKARTSEKILDFEETKC
jgi:hypothetical protein